MMKKLKYYIFYRQNCHYLYGCKILVFTERETENAIHYPSCTAWNSGHAHLKLKVCYYISKKPLLYNLLPVSLQGMDIITWIFRHSLISSSGITQLLPSNSEVNAFNVLQTPFNVVLGFGTSIRQRTKTVGSLSHWYCHFRLVLWKKGQRYGF